VGIGKKLMNNDSKLAMEEFLNKYLQCIPPENRWRFIEDLAWVALKAQERGIDQLSEQLKAADLG
jgi:hypothetical protein